MRLLDSVPQQGWSNGYLSIGAAGTVGIATRHVSIGDAGMVFSGTRRAAGLRPLIQLRNLVIDPPFAYCR
jgi:hypothetical protein